jgi:hypothetical protein
MLTCWLSPALSVRCAPDSQFCDGLGGRWRQPAISKIRLAGIERGTAGAIRLGPLNIRAVGNLDGKGSPAISRCTCLHPRQGCHVFAANKTTRPVKPERW